MPEDPLFLPGTVVMIGDFNHLRYMVVNLQGIAMVNIPTHVFVVALDGALVGNVSVVDRQAVKYWRE